MLEQLVGRQRLVCECGDFAGGELRDVLERPDGDADGHGGDLERGVRQLRDPQQSDVDAWLVEDGEAAAGRHEYVLGDEVVAAGAAQSGNRPCVVDLDVAR